MVFNRLALGFTSGVFFSMACNDNVYLVTSALLVRPHVRYMSYKKEHMTKNEGTNMTLVEHYMRDVLSSFVIFWISIGPVLYKTYVKKINIFGEEEQYSDGNSFEDSFATMLKKAFSKRSKIPQEKLSSVEENVEV